MKLPESYRVRSGKYATRSGDPYGQFCVPGSLAFGRALNIIASDGLLPETEGWEHVSVSVYHPQKLGHGPAPSWREMALVKALFWDDTQWAVQFHPPVADHINVSPGVLHLWHLPGKTFPVPPKICV